MKKIILLAVFAIMATGVQAQDSTFLFQNFNLCDSTLSGAAGTVGEHFPPGWSSYNVLGTTQNWQCYSKYGLGNSPCFQINGYQGGADNANENWLFTPKLDLHTYSTIKFNFYANYYYAGDSLHIMVSHNYSGAGDPNASGVTWTELTHTGIMQYDTAYNTNIYMAFQCDLAPHKSTPCYVAFKYTSTTSDGSRWDLDSVFTSGIGGGPSGLTNINEEKLSLKVIGTSTSDKITLGCDVAEGKYNLAIFDMVGRKLYDETINAQAGEHTYSINNINLAKGMYVVRMSNENSFGVAKTVVQ